MSDGRRRYEPDLPTCSGSSCSARRTASLAVAQADQATPERGPGAPGCVGEQRLAGLLGGLLSPPERGKVRFVMPACSSTSGRGEKAQVRSELRRPSLRASKQLRRACRDLVRASLSASSTRQTPRREAGPTRDAEGGRVKSQCLVGGRARGHSAQKRLGPVRDEHVGGESARRRSPGERTKPCVVHGPCRDAPSARRDTKPTPT